MLKKWAGVGRSVDTGLLYRSRDSFGLGLTSVSDHYKYMQLIKCQLLQASNDSSISILYASKKARETKGRVWRPTRALAVVDSEVQLKCRYPEQVGKAGLGHGKFNPNPSKSERRKLAAKVIKGLADQNRVAHAHSLVSSCP